MILCIMVSRPFRAWSLCFFFLSLVVSPYFETTRNLFAGMLTDHLSGPCKVGFLW